MSWMKWRHKFNHGPGVWEYRYLGKFISKKDKKENLKEICDDLSLEFQFSEGYRGIDYELVDKPPKEVLQEKLKETNEKINQLQLMKRMLEQALGAQQNS